jgi:hypothetical protein
VVTDASSVAANVAGEAAQWRRISVPPWAERIR